VVVEDAAAVATTGERALPGSAFPPVLAIPPRPGYGVGGIWRHSGRCDLVMRASSCSNMNHRRSDAPVRFCPNCGEVVNVAIAIKSCSEEVHATKRKNMETFCVDCGERLIK